MAPLLSVLTDPVPIGSMFLRERGRRVARAARDLLLKRKWYQHRRFRGHFAVTRSLVEGLEEIGGSFNYNPTRAADLGSTVVALSGVATVRHAIELKRSGKIKRLLAGPNVVAFSSDAGSILASPEIDLVIVPCQWVIDLYVEDNPSLADHIWAWPAGVDTTFWSPSVDPRNQVLVFEKQASGPVGPVDPYMDYLRSIGETPKLIRYGEYSHAQFLKELRRSKVMVGFGSGESQGLAWAEAWSADVPTLLWKNGTNVHRGRRYASSTAPYLTPRTGLFFDDLPDFRVQFARWRASLSSFQAREWVLTNMSDRVCAELLLTKALNG